MNFSVPFERRRRSASVAVAASLVVAVFATAGIATPQPAAAADPSPGAASLSPAAPDPCGTDPFTLVIEDVEGPNPGPSTALDQLNAEFQTKHPNVTINRVKTSFSDLQTKQPLEISGPTPPDITEIAVPTATFAKFANGGLIVNLDEYAKTYGWVARSGEGQLFRSRFDASGQIGTGPLYGLPQAQEIDPPIFYNKAMLAKLGLQLPTTWDEYLASLAAAKQAGEIPMMLGNTDKWPAWHAFSTIYNRYVPSAVRNAWVYRTDPAATFDTPGFTQAAQLFQDWGAAGYFTPEANAVTYDDAWKRFTEGEGLYLPAGSWLTSGIQDAMGDNAGLFLAPPSTENPALQVEAGPGQSWAITTASQHQDCAAAYLDFMTSQRGGELLIQNNAAPGFSMATIPDIAPGPFADLVSALQAINSSYAISANGSPGPQVDDAVQAGLQALLVGNMTPEAWVKSVQEAYVNSAPAANQ